MHFKADVARSMPRDSPPESLDSSSIGRSVLRVLQSEPWWLRGVSRELVGMVLLLAAMQSVPHFLRAWISHGGEWVPWEYAFYDLATQLVIGMAILLIASVLVNLPRPRIPLSLALAAAVLLGTFVPINVIAHAFYSPLASVYDGSSKLVYANWLGRRIALPWAIAATAWYFLRRAAARDAELRTVEMARRRLETGMLEAQLRALQAQVEPHFLFNTLAHVRRLFRTDPNRARLMLDSFRTYLRSALPQMRDAGTTLGRELDLVGAYLDVQRIRMGRRLVVRVDVPERLRDRALPAMMLISLVENAIKHGLNPLPRGGTIEISARERDGVLEISVADTGRGFEDEIGAGVGLANVRGRLSALHGARAQLSLVPNAPSGVRATIRLPAASVSTDAAAPAAVSATLA